MTEGELDAWLRAYGRAWEERDPEAAVRLFTPDATYRESPFDPPATGSEAIRRYWAANTSAQEDVQFGYETLDLAWNRAIVRWRAELRRAPSGIPSRLDGIFLLNFSADGRCASLLEWWHRRDG